MADAYDVSSPTTAALADAIIARSGIQDGEYDRDAVANLIGFIAADASTLTELENGNELPNEVLHRMADLIASDPPATVPEWDLLEMVIGNVRAALGIAPRS